jgi:hypothetical protein
VAAICAEGIIFGASDRMLTAGDVEFEPESQKIYSITNSIALMIAGESSLQMEIYSELYAYAGQKIRESPTEWLPIRDVANEYFRIYQRIKSDQAQARILSPLGLTRDTFVQRQSQLAPSVATELTREILNFDMPVIQAIITGIDNLGAHIYVVTNSEVLCQDAIGFASIGVGFWHANSQFMFAGHHRSSPLPETLLLTYAAKKRAEVAPGVGEGTDMFAMGPNPGSFSMIFPHIVVSLDGIYKDTREKTTEVIAKSNKRANEYVEQLIREAEAKANIPEQQPPSSRPAEKTDGKQTTTGGDGSGKPN